MDKDWSASLERGDIEVSLGADGRGAYEVRDLGEVQERKFAILRLGDNVALTLHSRALERVAVGVELDEGQLGQMLDKFVQGKDVSGSNVIINVGVVVGMVDNDSLQEKKEQLVAALQKWDQGRDIINIVKYDKGFDAYSFSSKNAALSPYNITPRYAGR